MGFNHDWKGGLGSIESLPITALK